MRSYLSVAAGIALAVTSALAVAQDTVPAVPAAQPAPAEEPAGPPLYRVELIVFAYRDFDAAEERFDHEQPPSVEPQDAVPLEVPELDLSSALAPDSTPPAASGPANATVGPDADATAEPVNPFRFRLLTPEEYQLDAAYQKIERIPAYIPLLHSGWVQPGLPDDQARPVDLALLGTANPSGNVRVYLSRFLHVELGLTYRRGPDSTAVANPTTTSTDPTPLAGPDDLHELTLAPRYQLVTQRQVRSGDLNYFDHPAFGVLVMITPVPIEPETPATATPIRPAA